MARSRWTRCIVVVLAALVAALGAGSASAALGADATPFGPTSAGWARGLATATADAPDWSGHWVATTTCTVPACAGEKTAGVLDITQSGETLTGTTTDPANGDVAPFTGTAAGSSATLVFQLEDVVDTFRLTLSADGTSLTGTITATDRTSGTSVEVGTIVATRDAFSLAGRIVERTCGQTCKVTGVSGVEVDATGGPGGPLSAVTDAKGRYELRVAAGTWTLTPTAKGRTFDPAERVLEVNADRKGLDFVSSCRPLGSKLGRRLSTAAKTITYTGTTSGVCPQQTFTLRVRNDGSVVLVSWVFTPRCELDGKLFDLKRPITVTGDDSDDPGVPDPRTGNFRIHLESPDGQANIHGRLLKDGTMILTAAFLKIARDKLPIGANCPVGTRYPLQLRKV